MLIAFWEVKGRYILIEIECIKLKNIKIEYGFWRGGN